MSILVRIMILGLIIFLGGFCSGMLLGLHINEKYKAKHIISKYRQKREREKEAEIRFSKWLENLISFDK